MKTKLLFSICCSLILSFPNGSFSTPGVCLNLMLSCTLTVHVPDIRHNKGQIHLLLFNQAAGFPLNPENAYRHFQQDAFTGAFKMTIRDLTPGQYAAVIFHDTNSNDQFDRSWFGSPKEDYGFSNMPYEFCGTPSFQQTSFTVKDDAQSITIKLIKAD